MSKLQPLIYRIHFLDGKTKAIVVECSETSADALCRVSSKIGLQSTYGWALYEVLLLLMIAYYSSTLDTANFTITIWSHQCWNYQLKYYHCVLAVNKTHIARSGWRKSDRVSYIRTYSVSWTPNTQIPFTSASERNYLWYTAPSLTTQWSTCSEQFEVMWQLTSTISLRGPCITIMVEPDCMTSRGIIIPRTAATLLQCDDKKLC
jgi:hypothetical protein